MWYHAFQGIGPSNLSYTICCTEELLTKNFSEIQLKFYTLMGKLVIVTKRREVSLLFNKKIHFVRLDSKFQQIIEIKNWISFL